MAARGRIKEKLKAVEAREQPEEMKFMLGDGWHVRLFLALCRRYGLKPYRRHGQRRTIARIIREEVFKDPEDPEGR